MPGIVGMISQRPPEECQSLVKSMIHIMEHESFYDSGMYSVLEMGVYAGWVAHEGSFAAGQPFFEDPSNDNSAFARTRLKALRGLFDVEGLDRPALRSVLARRLWRARLSRSAHPPPLLERARPHPSRPQ